MSNGFLCRAITFGVEEYFSILGNAEMLSYQELHEKIVTTLVRCLSLPYQDRVNLAIRKD